MLKIATRGPKEGVCNICGDHGPLTEDHTPPKGAVSITQVELKSLVELLSASPPGARGRVSQNGVKFRTLCGRCNNGLLGGMYDPEFNQFTQQVGRYLKTAVHLPGSMSVRGKPALIARSVLGHLAALGVDRYKKGPKTEAFKEYFLDETLPFPEWLEIYYWVHPYKVQVLVRDAVIRSLHAAKPATFWLMKFFPLAFFVVWDDPGGYDYARLQRFSQWRSLGPNDEVEMPVDLMRFPHERWPEAPEDHSLVMYGQASMGVWEKPKRRKR